MQLQQCSSEEARCEVVVVKVMQADVAVLAAGCKAAPVGAKRACVDRPKVPAHAAKLLHEDLQTRQSPRKGTNARSRALAQQGLTTLWYHGIATTPEKHGDSNHDMPVCCQTALYGNGTHANATRLYLDKTKNTP